MSTTHTADYDVIAVGAGFAGISLSYHLREAGFNVKVFDRASDVGGTWAWNKYPGAATDSESYYYCLTFSKEVLQEWSWSKRYSGWQETQNYLKFVMDKWETVRDIPGATLSIRRYPDDYKKKHRFDRGRPNMIWGDVNYPSLG